MAVGSFFLCSPDCPKLPRTSFPFYKFFYPIISPRISEVKCLRALLTHTALEARLKSIGKTKVTRVSLAKSRGLYCHKKIHALCLTFLKGGVNTLLIREKEFW